MDYKISILVAAYNAENYIEECLDSLVNQTLREIQIICIDDASTDNTLSIIERYASSDQRILVLRQPVNQGQAKARNLGLVHATGEFITMVDSDDWLDTNALKELYDVAIASSSTDAVLFNLIYYYQNKNLYVPYLMRTAKQHFLGKEAFMLSLDWDIHGLYIIRSSIHKRYPYDDTCKLYSDDNTTRIHFLHCREVRVSNAKYYYRQYSDSMTKKCSIRRFDTLDAGLSLKNLLLGEGMDDSIVSLQETYRWRNLVGEYIYLLRHKSAFTAKEKKEIIEKFRFHLQQMEVKRISKKLRYKFGYIPFTGSFKLFHAQSSFYDRLQRMVHRIRGIKETL